MSFEQFCSQPAPAVALDGYVDGPTRYDLTGPWLNFNHHDGCERFGTRASCEQVAAATRGGLWELFPDPDAVAVHVNDCDADVALATWLLEYPARVDETAVELLVSVEGGLDTTGGCAGPDDLDLLSEISWVFDPYTTWRTGNGRRDAAAETAVIEACWERIDAFADGRAGTVDIASHLEITRRDGLVGLVVEHGPMARLGLRAAGVSVFVTARAQAGRTVVTVGRTGPFVPADFDAIWDELNDLEGCVGSDRWGGGDCIGGSPRAGGTDLPVGLVFDVVARHSG